MNLLFDLAGHCSCSTIMYSTKLPSESRQLPYILWPCYNRVNQAEVGRFFLNICVEVRPLLRQLIIYKLRSISFCLYVCLYVYSLFSQMIGLTWLKFF